MTLLVYMIESTDPILVYVTESGKEHLTFGQPSKSTVYGELLLGL